MVSQSLRSFNRTGFLLSLIQSRKGDSMVFAGWHGTGGKGKRGRTRNLTEKVWERGKKICEQTKKIFSQFSRFLQSVL